MARSLQWRNGYHPTWPAIGLTIGASLALGWSFFSWSTYRMATEHLFWHVSLRLVVNNGLLTIFFLVIGWELAHELHHGALRERRRLLVPTAAALGGMIGTVAVSVLMSLVFHIGGLRQGWGVCMATDIAFVIGVLAFCGPRIPHELRMFLLILAIVDDLGSLTVLAVFAQRHPRIDGLALAFVVIALLLALRKRLPWWSLSVGGVALWLALWYAGTEPALAGLVIGLCEVPTIGTNRLAYQGQRLNATVILPLFAVCSCGVWWSAVRHHPVFSLLIGIVAVRLVGKVVGIYASVVLAERFGQQWIAPITRRHLLGAGFLCAMGFTVPLIFAQVTFGLSPSYYAITAGLMIASVAGGIIGVLILRGAKNTSVQ